MRCKIMEFILAKYWAPKGTPHWKNQLTVVLLLTLQLSVLVVFDAIDADTMLIGVAMSIPLQYGLSYMAIQKWGENPPKGSIYYQKPRKAP